MEVSETAAKAATMPQEKAPKPGMLTEGQYKDRMKRRFFRTLEYVSIAVSVAVIYGVFLVADYLLLKLIGYLFHDEMSEAPFLATFFKAARVGLAILAFVLCVVHGVRAAWEQYWRDIQISREDEKPHA